MVHRGRREGGGEEEGGEGRGGGRGEVGRKKEREGQELGYQ